MLLIMVSRVRCLAKSRVSAMLLVENWSDAVICSPERGRESNEMYQEQVFPL